MDPPLESRNSREVDGWRQERLVLFQGSLNLVFGDELLKLFAPGRSSKGRPVNSEAARVRRLGQFPSWCSRRDVLQSSVQLTRQKPSRRQDARALYAR